MDCSIIISAEVVQNEQYKIYFQQADALFPNSKKWDKKRKPGQEVFGLVFSLKGIGS